MTQILDIKGERFYLLDEKEFSRLKGGNDFDLPSLPSADRHGNRPAVEFMRVTIARDIISRRKMAGLTQQGLADLAGVRQETISRLESGKHTVSETVMRKIETALSKACSGVKRKKTAA